MRPLSAFLLLVAALPERAKTTPAETPMLPLLHPTQSRLKKENYKQLHQQPDVNDRFLGTHFLTCSERIYSKSVTGLSQGTFGRDFSILSLTFRKLAQTYYFLRYC